MNWIEFNKSYGEFVELKRNLPGALIEVLFKKRRRYYLIGDINPMCSSASGGKPFTSKAIVLRYKYIWGHWEPGKHSYEYPEG